MSFVINKDFFLKYLINIAGEWWNANVVNVEKQGQATGSGPINSDAFTMNGFPGDLYPCSQKRKSTFQEYY